MRSWALLGFKRRLPGASYIAAPSISVTVAMIFVAEAAAQPPIVDAGTLLANVSVTADDAGPVGVENYTATFDYDETFMDSGQVSTPFGTNSTSSFVIASGTAHLLSTGESETCATLRGEISNDATDGGVIPASTFATSAVQASQFWQFAFYSPSFDPLQRDHPIRFTATASIEANVPSATGIIHFTSSNASYQLQGFDVDAGFPVSEV